MRRERKKGNVRFQGYDIPGHKLGEYCLKLTINLKNSSNVKFYRERYCSLLNYSKYYARKKQIDHCICLVNIQVLLHDKTYKVSMSAGHMKSRVA